MYDIAHKEIQERIQVAEQKKKEAEDILFDADKELTNIVRELKCLESIKALAKVKKSEDNIWQWHCKRDSLVSLRWRETYTLKTASLCFKIVFEERRNYVRDKWKVEVTGYEILFAINEKEKDKYNRAYLKYLYPNYKTKRVFQNLDRAKTFVEDWLKLIFRDHKQLIQREVELAKCI